MPGQNTGLSGGSRTHDIAQSVMTLRGSDLLDWIEQSFQQEKSNINMGHKAFLATAVEKKAPSTHPVLYQEGEVNCVLVHVCARRCGFVKGDRDSAKVL